MAEFSTVKPGDPITSDLWNRLLRATERTDVLYGGDNMRVTKTPHGTLIHAKHVGGFLHPWRVLASNTKISVYPGLINGRTPTINDKPMTDRVPPPLLELSKDSFNKGLGWVALELETDKDKNDKSETPNMYATIKTAKVVQCQMIASSEKLTDNPFFYFGYPGIGDFKVRYPLARLQLVGDGVNVYQVAMFNLNWKAKPPQPTGGGTAGTALGSAFPRHFFWPA